MPAAEIYTEPWIYWLEAAGIHLERTRECREISDLGDPDRPPEDRGDAGGAR